jgi:hypothetical protein
MDLEVVQTVIQAGILITVVYIAKTTGGKTGPGPSGGTSGVTGTGSRSGSDSDPKDA